MSDEAVLFLNRREGGRRISKQCIEEQIHRVLVVEVREREMDALTLLGIVVDLVRTIISVLTNKELVVGRVVTLDDGTEDTVAL